MEDHVFAALSQLGSSGIVAGILWVIAKRFMDGGDAKHIEIITQFTARISALEKSSEECNNDRKRLHSEMIQLARTGTIVKPKPKRKPK